MCGKECVLLKTSKSPYINHFPSRNNVLLCCVLFYFGVCVCVCVTHAHASASNRFFPLLLFLCFHLFIENVIIYTLIMLFPLPQILPDFMLFLPPLEKQKNKTKHKRREEFNSSICIGQTVLSVRPWNVLQRFRVISLKNY